MTRAEGDVAARTRPRIGAVAAVAGECEIIGMTVTLRPATAADIAAMHAIRLAARENRLVDAGAVSEASYLPYLDNEAIWVAVAGGRIAGFAALDVAGASVWALFVDPPAEGAGIGRALQDALLAEAAERNLSRLHLTTSPQTRAELFYRATGWKACGMTEAGELRFQRAVPRRSR